MLRLFLRSIAINFASIYIAILILNPVISYVGGLKTLISAAVIIALANLFVRPIINLLLLPIHLITLGLFRWVANLGVLYLVTIFVPNLKIHSFISPRLDLGYLILPPIHFSAFGSFILATITLTLVFHFLYWLLQD
jgi:putative membrane protein